MNITIHRDGQNYGPYSVPDVRQHLASGSLTLTDLAFIEGASEWTTLGQVPGFASSTPPPPPSRALSTDLPVEVSPKSDFSNLKPYYQKQFQKIEESNDQRKFSWNWPAFFFAFIWAFSKGLNKNGILFLIIIVLVQLSTQESNWWIIRSGLLFHCYYGCRANWLYYNKAKYNNQLWM
jgi:hypothetical protein